MVIIQEYGLHTVITEVITKEFKIDYNPRHTRRLLQKMGFSFKRPKKVLSISDPKAQKSWKSYKYPRIKKKVQDKNTVLLHGDEASFRQDSYNT